MKTSDERVASPSDSGASGGKRFHPKRSKSGTRHLSEGAPHFIKPPRSAIRGDHLPAQPESAQPALSYPPDVPGNPGFESLESLTGFLRKHLFFILSLCAAASFVGASAGFYFASSALPEPMQAQSSKAEPAPPTVSGPSPSEAMAIGIAEMRRIASEDLDVPTDQAQAAKGVSAMRTQAVPAADQPCSAASKALALCGKNPP